MAQDNIAKLMAIAGKTAAANEPASAQDLGDAADQGAEVGDATTATPPPLATSRASAEQAPRTPDQIDGPARRVARRRPAGPVRGKIAANDDVPSIGGLIYALEQKPQTRIYRLAAIASFIWLIGGLAFAAFSLAPEWTEGTPFTSLLLKPVTYYTLTAIVVPIAIFWLLALLNYHIATLALKSSTMTEVAIRLAEPDRAAEQSIASLGQAVRRQVSFMNDAVSRALGRAGELEALVHNQVADLERSYEQNERRIRGLIQELTGERHALLNTSTGVTETLKSLGTEIPLLIEKLSTQQVTLAGIIRGAGENLAALEGSLAQSTGRFENVLGSRTQELQTVLEDYTSAFSTALGARTEQMRVAFDGYMHTLDTSLGNRTENLQTVFEEYARALDTTLANRAQALDVQLVERTRSLDDAFQKRLEMFDHQISTTTGAIDAAVNERAQMLTSALDLHARTFRETMARQAADLDESVMTGINAVHRTSENITRQTVKAIEGLHTQSEVLQRVSENLFAQIHGVTQRFETQGQTILRAAGTLDDANQRIDSTLQTRHADLSRTLDRLSGKADEFGRIIADYSGNLEGSLSTIEQRAQALTHELREGADAKSRALLSELERVKSQTEAESERALTDLRNRFTNVSGELTQQFDSLSSRLASATDETRHKASEAVEVLAREQARIRAEAARLPQTARDSADAMRRALQDQLKALEKLTQISQHTAQSRDVMTPDAQPLALTPLSRQAAALPVAEPVTQRPQQRVAAPESREGWSLGDLLARASHDTEDDVRNAEPKPAPQQPFRLDVGTIARAIDPATANAIWNRVRGGQRNVMVRSIYSADVRDIFDTVSSRVKTDKDLAQTVLRYLSDFERIIKESDARDPSGRLTQTHLISDTGRVYLFLAHAAGRIA